MARPKSVGYSLPMNHSVKKSSPRTTVSRKHQVTIPKDPFDKAGLRVGDRLTAVARGPGRVLLVRQDDPLDRYAGALTGTYAIGELATLRSEWD